MRNFKIIQGILWRRRELFVKLSIEKKTVFKSLVWVLIVMLLAIFWYKAKYEDRDEIEFSYISKDGSSYLDEIVDGQEVCETFIMPVSELEGFSLALVTFGRKNDMTLDVTLKRSDGDIVKQWKLQGNEIEDNSDYDFMLRGVEKSVVCGEKYEVILSTENASEGNAVSVRVSEKEGNRNAQLVINGKEYENDICMKIYYSYEGFFKAFFWTISIMIALVMGIGIIIVENDKVKLHYKVGICLLLVGTVFMVVLPPLTSPDEEKHYANAYAISNFLMGEEVTDEDGLVYVREEDTYGIIKNLNGVMSYYRFYCTENPDYEDAIKERTSHKLGRPLDISPIAYVVSGVAITMGRLLKFHSNALMLFGAWVNLLVYCGIVTYAIKLIPYGKRTLAMISFLPMVISTLASYSYDVINLALIILFFAACMYCVYEKEKITWKDTTGLVILAILFVPIKVVYIGIVGTVFLIGNDKYKNRYQAIASKLAVCIISCAVTLIGMLSRVNTNTVKNAEGISMGILAWVCHLGKVYANTIIDYSTFYVKSMIGYSLGSLNVIIPDWLIICIGALLVLTVVLDGNKIPKKPFRKCFCWVLGIGGCGLVLISSYFIFGGNEGADLVQGIQGRYFIPLLIYLPFMFASNQIEEKNSMTEVLLKSAMFLNVLTIFEVMYVVLG